MAWLLKGQVFQFLELLNDLFSLDERIKDRHFIPIWRGMLTEYSRGVGMRSTRPQLSGGVIVIRQ